jgi:hypothetical protein
MIPREKIIIDASGKPGEHAVQHHGQREAVGTSISKIKILQCLHQNKEIMRKPTALTFSN